MNKTTVSQDLKRITDYFQDRKEVAAVYLFGSFGGPRENRESDIDIAILLDETKSEKNYNRFKDKYFAASPNFSLKSVDIVILNDASSYLKHRILRTGKLLLEKNRPFRVRFTQRAILEYLDYRPIEEICLKGVANRVRRKALGG